MRRAKPWRWTDPRRVTPILIGLIKFDPIWLESNPVPSPIWLHHPHNANRLGIGSQVLAEPLENRFRRAVWGTAHVRAEKLVRLKMQIRKVPGLFWMPDCWKVLPVELTKRNAKKCTQCDQVMAKRQGPKGKFWGCSGYPGCKYTESD